MNRSPLRWHGGKSFLADWILSLMPEHVHYVEPYFGGGSLLFSKSPEQYEGVSEVVNDLDEDLTNFWEVLRDPRHSTTLYAMLNNTPVSEYIFRKQKALLESGDGDCIDRAFAYFVVNRQSRQGLGKDFNTLSRNRTRRGMNEQASAWLTAISLGRFADRLQRVVILNRPAIDVIKQQDSKGTLHILDPPYFPDTRVAGEYAHEMTADDHVELLDTLESIEGKFLLCGYQCETYNKWASRNGFEVFTKEAVAQSSGNKSKPTRTETVWRKS